MSSPPLASVHTQLDETVRAIRARLPSAAPRVGVVLGSGLGAFGDSLEGLTKIPYAEIPNMPALGKSGAALTLSCASAACAESPSSVCRGACTCTRGTR